MVSLTSPVLSSVGAMYSLQLTGLIQAYDLYHRDRRLVPGKCICAFDDGWWVINCHRIHIVELC
jgi:hypothetical protein